MRHYAPRPDSESASWIAFCGSAELGRVEAWCRAVVSRAAGSGVETQAQHLGIGPCRSRLAELAR